MNILSLFGGIECGRVALERAGIPIDKYYSSEVDPYAIKIANKNYPDIIQLGDINNIDFTQFIGKIDLIMGGSPCQNLSIVNKKSRDGLEGDKSKLFYKFVEAVATIKPKYFLFENVASMNKKDREVISDILGVKPVLINSALVSAQTRNRLYWTNIGKIEQPEDKGIFIKDVLEKYVDEKYYISEKMKGYIFACPSNFTNNYKINCEKARPLVTKHDKRANTTNYYSDDFINGGDKNRIRRLTPLECERLQTLPDGYTAGLSDTRRYIAIGNGWTVDVITYIFKGLKVE